jgi:hypothetical protein
MSYTEVTISSYNSNPPTDDGSTGASNEITWSGVKTKLGDPINTAFSSVNTNVAAACSTLDAAIAAQETAIAAIETDLSGYESALYAPAGTRMPFGQTAAPTLWTKDTTHNNKAMRLVTGTVTTGGSTAFTSIFASRTLTTTEMPAHTHSFSDSSSAISFDRSAWVTNVTTDTNTFDGDGNTEAYLNSITEDFDDVDASVSFSGTTSSTGSGSAMDFAIQYVDVIIAQKD